MHENKTFPLLVRGVTILLLAGLLCCTDTW